jgi:hypothetical protein
MNNSGLEAFRLRGKNGSGVGLLPSSATFQENSRRKGESTKIVPLPPQAKYKKSTECTSIEHNCIEAANRARK